MVRADTIVELRYGRALPELERRVGQIPVYGTNGRCGWHDEALVTGPGVILGRKGMGNLGVEWCAGPYWVIDTAYYVYLKTSSLDLRFFFYLISYIGLNHLKDGTSNPSLSRDTFGEQLLPVPPILVQHEVARILSALDDKIEQNRRTSAALEQVARATFRAWFVDFEPVKAKAAGTAAFPSMPRAIFDALPTRLLDSELGPVPEGWEIGQLKGAATLSKTQVSPQDEPDEVFEHYSIPAFDAGRRAVRELGAAIKSNKLLVEPECLLVSKLNPRIPRIWLPPPASGRRQIASTEFLVASPNNGWDRDYLYCLVQQSEFRNDLAQSASGTSNSHQRVRPEDFLGRTMVLPPDAWRIAFREQAAPLLKLSAALHAESASLEKLRDYLLPKLLSGVVRVREAERAIAEAV
jgi:type I restriction enzyme S subunit